MAESIDRVQIDIEANAIGTTRVFKQLEEHINIVKKALDTINVSKLVQAQKAINNANINSDALGMSKAEQNIKNSVNSIKASLAGLGAYANAAMNGDKSSYTSFERRVISIQSAIDVLKEKMAQLGNVRVPTPAMDSIQKQMEDTKSALESFERKAQEMRDTGKNVTDKETYVEVLHALRDASLEFDRLKAKQDELANSGKAWIYPMDEYKKAVDRASASLSDMASKVRGAIPKETKEEAKETAQEVGNIFKAHKDSHLLLKALKNIHKAMTKLRHATIDAGKNGFMKLLKYGLGIRSVYVLFRRLRKVVTDSFGDLQKSGAFFETTAANVLALRTALVTLKFQFGAAFEPIFNAVAPALEKFINDLITAMNALSAFTARLMGQSTYSKVQMVTLATEKAAKNAKELNKQLQKFDELNNLTTNKNGSGSTGKTDDHAVYTTATVDSALGDFGKRLADQLRAGDWAGVGQTISDKLVEELKGINWEDIKRKAGNIGQKFADFFNSLLNPELLSEVGHAIGEALNSALTFFNEWGKGLHFEDIGRALAEGFNAWLEAGNLPLLGETLHTWIAGGLDALNTFLEEADFEELGKQLAEFIGNLNIPDLAGKLLTLAKNILKALAEALGTAFKEGDISTKIILAIGVGLGALSFVGKLAGLAKKIGVALGLINASQWGLGGAANTIAGGLGSQLATKTISIGSVLKVALLAGVAFTLSKVIWKMANGEFDSLQDLIDSLPGSKVEAIKKDIDIQAKLDKAGKSVEDLRNIFGGLNKEIQDTNYKQGDFFDNTSRKSASAGHDLEKNYSTSLNSVNKSFNTAYTNANTTWSKIGNDGKTFSSNFASAFNGMPGLVSNQFASGYAQSTMKWSGLEAWANKTLGTVPSAAQSKLSQVPGHFSNNFGTATNQAQSKVSLFHSWFSRLNFEKTAKMKTDDTSFNSAKRSYDSLINTMKNKTVTISVKAEGFSAIGSQIQRLSSKLSSLSYASTYQNLGYSGVRRFATGGIVTGATRAIVGEAGAEAVIPLTDGTLGSLSKMIVGEMAKPQVAQVTSSVTSGFVGSADSSVAEQNALLREEVQLLRQIAGKELTISSSEVFNATRSESNNYYNRTGNSPFLF